MDIYYGISSGNLPCPTCFTGGAGGVYQVTSLTGPDATCTVQNNTGNNTSGDASATCNCSNSNTNNCGLDYSASGLDTYGGFPVVAPAPLGGNYPLMLNNSNCGLLMQRANYSFVVSASSLAFTFQYAIVLQTGTHDVVDAPYFQVSVIDQTLGGSIVPCTSFSATAGIDDPGSLSTFTASTRDNSVYYKPWQTVTQDFINYNWA